MGHKHFLLRHHSGVFLFNLMGRVIGKASAELRNILVVRDQCGWQMD